MTTEIKKLMFEVGEKQQSASTSIMKSTRTTSVDFIIYSESLPNDAIAVNLCFSHPAKAFVLSSYALLLSAKKN